MSIWRLGYVEVRSLDLERDTRFWRDVVGLVETERGDGKAYFKCWDEQDHHSVILKQDTKAGIERVAFKVEGQHDLEAYQKKLHDAGVETAYVPSDVATRRSPALPHTQRAHGGAVLQDGQSGQWHAPDQSFQPVAQGHDLESALTATP